MTTWDWIDEFAELAHSRGDQERQALVDIHPEAYGFRHSDPAHMLALLEDGRRKAIALNEPWWVFFFDHWCLETLIYYQDDYRQIMDRAVRLTLDLRRPIFEQHPLKFHAHCNLLAAYLCIDPRGHATTIAQALEYLATEVPEEGEEKYLLAARRYWFAFEMERVEEATRLCLAMLNVADSEDDRHLALHHSVGGHLSLCRLALAREDWPALMLHSQQAEELATQRDAPYDRALGLLWQAVAARKAGLPQAGRLMRSAQGRFARLNRPLDDNYHDALAAYHELDGDFLEAIAVRTVQLDRLRDRGQHCTEAETRLHRLRLMALAGLDLAEEMPPLIQLTGRLGTPEYYRERAQRIVAGEIPRGILGRR